MTAEQASPPRRQRRSPWLQLAIGAPLVVFVGLALLLFVRLFAGDPSQVPSARIGREVPQFELAPLEGLSEQGAPVPGFSDADLGNGEVTIVNVWASWCIPCRDEHPFLVEIAEDERVKLFGINYKDTTENARRFLGRYGNPFDAVGVDASGRTGIDWGVYGVPETFVVDRQGRIAYKHIGPINERSLKERFMPEVEKALAAD
jgi:cytochrome c biogenesis protein CcmG, thiol:disulfide interchange protein DsbE